MVNLVYIPLIALAQAVCYYKVYAMGKCKTLQRDFSCSYKTMVSTFVSVAPPFEYNGDGTQNGVANWSTLGIDDFEDNSNFTLYPNPTSSILNIEIQNIISNGTLEIYDMLGKQIFNQTITSNNLSQIDVSSYNSGLYLIKISSENSAETKRFVKN